jgi:DnaJ-class molecular chaperone
MNCPDYKLILFYITMHINFYELMGISSECPQERVPQAFRSRVKQMHPDKCKSSDKIGESKEATIMLL